MGSHSTHSTESVANQEPIRIQIKNLRAIQFGPGVRVGGICTFRLSGTEGEAYPMGVRLTSGAGRQTAVYLLERSYPPPIFPADSFHLIRRTRLWGKPPDGKGA